MLDDASPIHTVNIRQRNRLGVLVDPHVGEADVVVEALAQDLEAGVGDDSGQFGGIGVAALLVEGIVFGEVDGDIGVKGLERVFLCIEHFDEGVEDGALLPLGRRTRGTIGFCGAGDRVVGPVFESFG